MFIGQIRNRSKPRLKHFNTWFIQCVQHCINQGLQQSDRKIFTFCHGHLWVDELLWKCMRQQHLSHRNCTVHFWQQTFYRDAILKPTLLREGNFMYFQDNHWLKYVRVKWRNDSSTLSIFFSEKNGSAMPCHHKTLN